MLQGPAGGRFFNEFVYFSQIADDFCRDESAGFGVSGTVNKKGLDCFLAKIMTMIAASAHFWQLGQVRSGLLGAAQWGQGTVLDKVIL